MTHSSVRPLCARLALIIFKVSGWKAAGQRPSFPKYVIIAAPHTSNWDFVYTICLAFILARGAGVPVVLGYLGYRQKVGGIGPTVHITGHMEADMKTIRGFYADIKGKYPGKSVGSFVVSESKMLP